MGETAIVERPAAANPSTVDIANLRRRYEQLKSLRGQVEQVWREIEEYFLPRGGTSGIGQLQAENQVDWTRPDVWDSTAIDSTQKLAASIHGSVTSPAVRWFKLAWRDEELKGNTEAAAWLDKVADRVFDTLQDSDFNTEIASADQELVAYATTFVVEEVANADEWKGVDFEAVPVAQGYFEEDSLGGIETFFRRLSWTAVQIRDHAQRDGIGDEGIPADILENAKEGKNLETRYEVVFCIFQRKERQREIERIHERNRERRKLRAEAQKQAQETRKEPARVEPDEPTYPFAPHLRPIGCVYFLGEKGIQIGKEKGYYEMPVTCARWQKAAGSVWGFGQCHILLPTVKYLNGWMEVDHQGAAKDVDPSLGVTERGLMSDLNLEPGGITVARSKDDLWVIESKGDGTRSQMKLEELRAMVRRCLFDDQLTLKDSPAMTATEVQARYELMNRVLGSTLARIENDLLGPIVNITLGHLLRAKQLPEMPELVASKFDAGAAHFNIEYQGPLARSQRTDEVAAIERVLAFAGALLKMGVPLAVVMATIDVVGAIREVAKRLGTPANLLKPEKEAFEMMAQIQAMQDRMAKAQAAETEGKAAQAHATAQAALLQRAQPGAGAGGPMPAMPQPLVAPTLAPTAPPVAG